MNLRNRVVVITGASSGFGRGAAVRFAEEGANVVLAARRKRLLKDVASECEEHGVRALVVETDVSEKNDVENLCKSAVKEFGHIDVWVNNAGAGSFGRFDETPLEEHEQVVQTDLLGSIYGSWYALRQFREQSEGVLINISSWAGRGSAPYHSSYDAAKHGVRGLGMGLRQELIANNESDHIHVCTVMPTSFDTPFFEHAANHMGKPVHPVPPVYDPEEVIETIVNLAHDPQDEVTVGRAAKVAGVLGKFFPGTIERTFARHTHKVLFGQKESARASSGSLFRPRQSGAGVYGGWTQQNGGKAWKIALGVGLPVLAGVVAWRKGLRPRDVDVSRAA